MQGTLLDAHEEGGGAVRLTRAEHPESGGGWGLFRISRPDPEEDGAVETTDAMRILKAHQKTVAPQRAEADKQRCALNEELGARATELMRDHAAEIEGVRAGDPFNTSNVVVYIYCSQKNPQNTLFALHYKTSRRRHCHVDVLGRNFPQVCAGLGDMVLAQEVARLELELARGPPCPFFAYKALHNKDTLYIRH